MTTLTIEIDKDQDLSAVKDFISRLGLKYEIEEQDSFTYTTEVQEDLDTRYQDYKDGKVELIDEEESKKQIQQLLASRK